MVRRLVSVSLAVSLAVSLVCVSGVPLAAQSAFRLPAALMISFLNRTQQIAYAIGVSDWERLQAESEGLANDTDSYAKLIPPGIPMASQLRDFRAGVQALIGAAGRRDGEEIGRWLGTIESGCIKCHKLYRDL